MTAIGFVAQRAARAGFIISDGAHCDMEGRVQDTRSGKVVFSQSRLSWAMGVTGNVHPMIVTKAIADENPMSLKQMYRRLPRAVLAAVRFTAQCQSKPVEAFQCMVGGVVWDAGAGRPRGFALTSDSSLIAGTAPYTYYEMDHAFTSDGSSDVSRFVSDDPTDPTLFDPELDGLRWITAVRRAPLDQLTPGMAPDCKHAVGGEIHLTRVDKTGVTVWVIHDFRDPVGERIDPTREGGPPEGAV